MILWSLLSLNVIFPHSLAFSYKVTSIKVHSITEDAVKKRSSTYRRPITTNCHVRDLYTPKRINSNPHDSICIFLFSLLARIPDEAHEDDECKRSRSASGCDRGVAVASSASEAEEPSWHACHDTESVVVFVMSDALRHLQGFFWAGALATRELLVDDERGGNWRLEFLCDSHGASFGKRNNPRKIVFVPLWESWKWDNDGEKKRSYTKPFFPVWFSNEGMLENLHKFYVYIS